MLPIVKKKIENKIRNKVKRIIRDHSTVAGEMEVDAILAGKAQVDSYYSEVFNRKESETVNLKRLDIAFLIPCPIKGSGGHRNMFRAIKYLRAKGHHITVYYCGTYENAKKVKKNVTEWFYDMTDIPFICYDGQTACHDVMIATWWVTAYYLKNNINKVKYPLYFVQDFENSFYPISSKYVLAENTYRMGISCICSGRWMEEYLVAKYQADAAGFQFPVNKDVYYSSRDDNREMKPNRILFFAKPEMPRRCYEIGISALAYFHETEPDVEIVLYGSAEIDNKKIPFPADCKMLLPKIEDLADLYRSADLGLVFSTTNPSLVPYEMMACGCPVVDIDMEMALEKYGGNENNVFLLSPDPEEMGKRLKEIIHDGVLLEVHRKSGLDWVDKEFPSEDEMGERVLELIFRKVTLGKIGASAEKGKAND